LGNGAAISDGLGAAVDARDIGDVAARGATEGVAAAAGVAGDRRTTGLVAGAGAGAGAETVELRAGAGDRIAPPTEAALVDAAAAARERGVAACRNAAQRPAGGLTADRPARAADDAGAMTPDPVLALGAETCCAAADPAAFGIPLAFAAAERGIRRTTPAERSAALALGAPGAGRDPASPDLLVGARSPGARFVGARFAGAAARSRSTSIGPTEVTSGGRRTRTTSPPSRPTMCPGRAASPAPVRTTRGRPRGGNVGNTAADEPGDAAAADVSSPPRSDHQYCHHRGGCTPWLTGRARTGSGPRSDRRTSGECAVAAANRVAAIATEPIGDGRERLSGGPGRRKWRATD
jgi:hypothetical protein